MIPVQVDVVNNYGKVLASQSQTITIVSPEIHFYEKNPLRGLLHKALPQVYTATGEEITLRAEGYYMDSALSDENLLAVWQKNGSDVAVLNDPYEVTLQKQEQRGTTELSFHLRNLTQLLQGARNTITIRF